MAIDMEADDKGQAQNREEYDRNQKFPYEPSGRPKKELVPCRTPGRRSLVVQVQVRAVGAEALLIGPLLLMETEAIGSKASYF